MTAVEATEAPGPAGVQLTGATRVWRRWRFWLVVAGVLVASGLLVAALSPTPGVPLDPGSADHDGSRALATLVRGYGASVETTSTVSGALDIAGASILVTAPDDYSADQLRDLVAHAGPAGRIVLVDPDQAVLDATTPGLQRDEPSSDSSAGSPAPGCGQPGAVAAGPVALPASTDVYTGAGTGCYGGAVVFTDGVVVLGTDALLRNDHLADDGVAALAVNVLTGNRTIARVIWLLPGADADGPGSPSVWDLFPGGVHRAFWWLAALLVLIALWRGRRLGPVIIEPLPVVVRAAEVVEGLGRLYRRAGARDRAAEALRAGTTQRLARHLGLPETASVRDVAARLPDPVAGYALLGDTVPADDAALLELSRELTALEGRTDPPTRTLPAPPSAERIDP